MPNMKDYDHLHPLLIIIMEAQSATQSNSKQIDPDCVFQITEEEESGSREASFNIKIILTKEMKARMTEIEKFKRERLAQMDARERSPEMVELKQRCDAIRKLDPKSLEEERRRNGYNNELNKSLAEEQHFKMFKEKYTIALFQSFQNRGKSPYIKFSYNSGEKYINIRINKNFFLNELHHSRSDLFNIGITFTKTWELDFHGMIRILWKIYTESQKPINYNLYIRSLDLISATFDIVYHDKKVYRFRYSPFQFRTSLTFKDQHQLTGYYQSLSCIPELNNNNNNKSIISDVEFYSTPRLFIFDDLTDNNLFFKILNRTNLIYQVYSISRGIHGSINQIDEFNKKCLGHFYFSTTRMKKILFTWSFKQFKRPSKERRTKEDDKQQKEVIFHVAFQLQRDNVQITEPVYRMRMQLLQNGKIISPTTKLDLAVLIKEWYLLIKEILCQRDRPFFQAEKQNLNRPKDYREIVKSQTEDFEMTVQFTSRDRFDKFFVGLLLLVSTVLDRHFFTLQQDRQRKRQEIKNVNQEIKNLNLEIKYVNLDTQQVRYSSNKKQYLEHVHYIRLIFRHSYFTSMFYSAASKEDKQSFYSFLQNSRSSDYRLRCGEWKLDRVLKIKIKNNIKDKEKKEVFEPEEMELTSFPQEFKRYISILLKHFPLRIIYNDILSFVESIVRTCYSPQEESNQININGYDLILRSIINVLLQQYYYCQFKEKEEKLKQKEKEKEKQREERSASNTNMKEQPKPQRPPESQQSRRQRMQQAFSRVLIVKILTKDSVGFTPQDKLLFEVTFKVIEFKSVWQTRVKQGFIIIRIFEDRLQFQKDYNIIQSIKGDVRSKKLSDEAYIKASIESCFFDSKATITL